MTEAEVLWRLDVLYDVVTKSLRRELERSSDVARAILSHESALSQIAELQDGIRRGATDSAAYVAAMRGAT